MTRIQFGFILPQIPFGKTQRNTFVEDVNQALKLVSGYFESARIIDHLGNNTGDIESFTALAYFSALHPRLKFGHTVICQSFRNPALVAKMGADLQFLTGGRFLLGIGAGWDEEEYRAFGYDFPPARVRVEQLEEALQIIKAMWTEKKATFSGEYYRVNEAECEPKPDPLPPIMVGAFKPKMLRITAKYADEWNVGEAFEGLALVWAIRATVRRPWEVVYLHARRLRRNVAGEPESTDPEDFDFVGTPKLSSDTTFIDLGVTSFMLDWVGFQPDNPLILLSSSCWTVTAWLRLPTTMRQNRCALAQFEWH
jgi:hypothetical protein